jgi:hypothetical protein
MKSHLVKTGWLFCFSVFCSMKEIRDEKQLPERWSLIEPEDHARAKELLESGRKIHGLGYWKEKEPGNVTLPHPCIFVDEQWNPEERQMVISYLEKGESLAVSMGLSWCRFNCGEVGMGAAELTDGSYWWPEGLAHYVEKHSVRLPAEFVKHVRDNFHARMTEQEKKDTVILMCLTFDLSWWKSQAVIHL